MFRLADFRALSWLLICVAAPPGLAMSGIDTVRINLAPLIEQAADNPNQFAVDVPHPVSLADSGAWTGSGATRTWRFAITVPGAVSLSFHAPRIRLPPSAVLRVSSAATTTLYRSADVADSILWSRIQPGDALEFALEVLAEEMEHVSLDISGFQAGYRGLTPEVRSHEVYRRMRAMAAGDPDTPCVENYACHTTPANLPAGQATVALTIENRFLCTGTMVNNTARDNTPYLLTARHCANGGFNPLAADKAATIVVYWNAMTACGEPLGTVLYSPNPQRQSGAKTVFEQQDAWLMRLDASPIVDDAHFAGFDAGGGDVEGGYSIHFALIYNKQYTRWGGRAFRFVMQPDALVPFPLDMLGVVNELGVGGPGASGGALFSAGHRVVGVASIAPTSTSQSGYGRCPAINPPAPDQSNASVFYNALSGVWTLAAPGTLSGNTTLKSLLDPLGTGATSVDSMPATRLRFTSLSFTSVYTFPVTLQWSAVNATSCTASGGVPGDGWTGVLPGNGTRQVSHSIEAEITYRLSCSISGGGTVSGSVVLRWTAPEPMTFATVDKTVAWPTSPVRLAWKSNYGPCSVSGGELARSDLNAEGSLATTSPVPGIVTYRVNCGTPPRTSSALANVNYMPPVLEMTASGSLRRPGEPVFLQWASYADTCIPTGGSPDDDWTGIARSGIGQASLTVMTAGTYDFGLTCTGGSQVQARTFRVVVADSPPFVELTPILTTVRLALTPADYIRFAFRTNLADCSRDLTGFQTRNFEYVPGESILPPNYFAEGENYIAPATAGSGLLSITCRSWPYGPNAGLPDVSASIPVTVLAPFAPTASIEASARSVSPTGTFTLTWRSTSAVRCEIITGDPQGSETSAIVEPAGSMIVHGGNIPAGEYQYRLRCNSIDGLQPAATASVPVRMEGASGVGGGSGGGGSDGGEGGGGFAGLTDLLTLLALLAGLRAAIPLPRRDSTTARRAHRHPRG